MKIYLDDNRTDKSLTALLRKAGHTVAIPVEVGLSGRSDACHLEHSLRNDLVLLTADRRDFAELHQLILSSGGRHPGIIVIRYDNDPKRDMKPKHIVTAIGKVEQCGIALANQIVVLNHWR